jgi:hypothetical protein
MVGGKSGRSAAGATWPVNTPGVTTVQDGFYGVKTASSRYWRARRPAMRAERAVRFADAAAGGPLWFWFLLLLLVVALQLVLSRGKKTVDSARDGVQGAQRAQEDVEEAEAVRPQPGTNRRP